MTHEYNRRNKKKTVIKTEAIVKGEKIIISTINCFKEEIINTKNIVNKKLQKENEKLHEKCIKLENNISSNESPVNTLEQYGWRKCVFVWGISGRAFERDFEETLKETFSALKHGS